MLLEKKILDEIKKDKNVKLIITDIRFKNEFNLIKKLNGKIIRVKRNIIDKLKDLHISENEMDEFIVDHDIINDKTIEDLYNNIDNLKIIKSTNKIYSKDDNTLNKNIFKILYNKKNFEFINLLIQFFIETCYLHPVKLNIMFKKINYESFETFVGDIEIYYYSNNEIEKKRITI